MNTDILSTSFAFLVFGLLAQFTNEHYLKNAVVSLNKYRLFKLDQIVIIRLIKIFAKGFILIGVLGILSYIFKRNSY